MISAVIPASFSELRNSSSVVVPASTPIFLPANALQAVRPVVADHQPGAVDKGRDREIDLLRAATGSRSSARTTDPPCPARSRRSGRQRSPARRPHSSAGSFSCVGQSLGDRAAQIDHIAGRLPALSLIGKRRSIVAIGDADRFGLSDTIERRRPMRRRPPGAAASAMPRLREAVQPVHQPRSRPAHDRHPPSWRPRSPAAARQG